MANFGYCPPNSPNSSLSPEFLEFWLLFPEFL